MNEQYIVAVDQSTQGTKALLFDGRGTLMCRCDLPHEQIVNELGWVSHDPEEIYDNTIRVIRNVLIKANVDPDQVKTIGISNQRETSVIWDRRTGKSLANAIVWQCARATDICERTEIADAADMIRQHTGINLSPYFPAAKIAWLLENVSGAKEKAKQHQVCHGTVDSYLLYRLTNGKTYATDYSNASRTQLFNIFTLKWDPEICALFGVDPENLPVVCDSNSCFGYSDFDGLFSNPIPIHAVLGDSHAALFGQNCRKPGMAKATYGTGSSIMMNIGDKPVLSEHGLVTSLAWGMDGQVKYVLEGNLNYTGAVITWLKDNLKLIDNPGETEELAYTASHEDRVYLVPAFTGLGAPYWNSYARACIVGMDRTTGKNEIVRAAVESIAYQITDILKAMNEDSGSNLAELRVDGGPTHNKYLMQFQSDIAGCTVQVPDQDELSGIGAAYAAGLAAGIWNENIFEKMHRTAHSPKMAPAKAAEKYEGWKAAVQSL